MPSGSASRYGDDGAAITTGAMLKWGSSIGVCTLTLVSAVWWIGTMNTRVVTVEHTTDQHTKQIDKLQERSAELQAKLDTAITILNRIDQKVGKP
jgi:hypothetical protein